MAATEEPEAAGAPIDEKTVSLKLADEYLRLSGKRRAKVDDNIVNTRLWEDEPKEASTYWADNGEPLQDK